MKKLFCLLVLLVTCIAQSALWDENTTWDKKFDDCIVAIENNDIKFFEDNFEEIVKSRILDGTNLSRSSEYKKAVEYYHYNLISIAVKKSRKEIAEVILKHKVEFNYSYHKMFPLYWAVRNALDNAKENKIQENDRAMVQLLLDNGFNPYMATSKDEVQSSSFDMAIRKNNLDLVTMFVEADKKQKFIRFGRDGAWPIHEALSSKKEDISLFLIEFNDSEDEKLINKKAQWGERPVHLAVMKKQYKPLELLINSGAKLDKLTKFEGTAVHIAAGNNNKDAIVQLIEHGANPAIKNKKEELAEDLTKNEDVKSILKNARTIQELDADFSEDEKSEKVFSLINSFPLLSFTMHKIKSCKNFSQFYECMNNNEKHIETITGKKNFKNMTDFRDSLLEKAALRLKAHFYNISMISEFEYTEKFGEKEFGKMLITANRIKKYNEKN